MKSIYVRILSGIVLATGPLAIAQGTFQNLNFEEANIVPISGMPYAVTVANALPGWTVDYGNVQQIQITYNDQSLGGTWVTLIANGYPTLTTITPIDGNASVLLFWGLYESQLADATISQTGQIPLGSQSLLFNTSFDTGQGPQPEAFIGTDKLTLFPVGGGTGENGVSYTTWGANISAWAGQTEQLSFSAISGKVLLDDISFSAGAVPEPSPFALMNIGAAAFALYRRSPAKRQ